MKNLFRDPLIHFVVVGALVFVGFWVVGEDDAADPRRVVVDRDALLTFIQYRTKVFDPNIAAARLDAMSETEFKMLVDDHVREEVLDREARAMGLDVDDYIIRRRLVQKMEFIAEGFAGSAPAPTDRELAEYFKNRQADYYSAALVTFTHVFVNAERRGWDEARVIAEELLERLRADGAAFADATRYGDRFPFHVNYVEREADLVASHFGADMADRVFTLAASDDQWNGPLESPYGVHLVLLVKSVPGRAPGFDEVRDRVADDAGRQRQRVLHNQALQAIVDSYDVEVTTRPQAR